MFKEKDDSSKNNGVNTEEEVIRKLKKISFSNLEIIISRWHDGQLDPTLFNFGKLLEQYGWTTKEYLKEHDSTYPSLEND